MKKQFRSFTQARKYACSLKLKNRLEWIALYKTGKKPLDIPKNPQFVYKNKGWKNWGDFLNTKNVSPNKMEFRNFDELKKFVKILKLNSRMEWFDYWKSHERPQDIPTNPNGTYKNKGWISWGDFLGTGYVDQKKRTYRNYSKAKIFAQTLNITSQAKWDKFAKSDKKPEDIPSNPEEVYKKTREWISWGDFLGTGFIAYENREYLSFTVAKKEARLLAKKYGIKNKRDWIVAKQQGKIPAELPASPWYVYSEGRVLKKK